MRNLFLFALMVYSLMASAHAATPAGPNANLVTCAKSVASLNFFTPAGTGDQGLFQNFLGAKRGIAITLGTEENPSLAIFTEDEIYLSKLTLFEYDGKLEAVIPDRPTTPENLRAGNLTFLTISDFPYIAHPSHSNKPGNFHDRPSDKLSHVLLNHKLDDSKKIHEITSEIENGLKQRMNHVANAYVKLAKSRAGRGESSDILSSTVELLRNAICECMPVKGMENLESEMVEKMTPARPPAGFKSIIIYSPNPARQRALKASDLSCRYLSLRAKEIKNLHANPSA